MESNISKQVKKIVAQECGLDVCAITNKTLFMAYSGIPYFNCMDVLFTIEHTFHGVHLPESDFIKYKTVGDLTKCVVKQLQQHKM